ncbi:deoxyribonuclease IV [Gorillibacterium timonense]|uniref:deoxyribonuclease IV n=1 Tax=Gorillibacterium timonense TaxID=1689269 RepID=UPI00071CF33B|nr:deoxyribonuclease IV [Gorillibacterium timonense]
MKSNEQDTPKIGCHISIRKGYLEAAHSAYLLGAGAYQYFPKNPRSLSVKSFNMADALSCASYSKEYGLVSIAHTPYPTNLAVHDPGLMNKTVESLLNDLIIAEACGSIGVVVHFGKGKSADPLTDYRQILAALDEVLKEWKGRAKLLIENQAGDGSPMGTTLHELVQIRSLASFPEKLGFCFDTCHAYASGLWRPGGWKELVEIGNQLGYWREVGAIHLNDSVYPFASRKDRHAGIGCGAIGESQLREVLECPLLREVPFVLETGVGADGTHHEEIQMAQEWARGTPS